MKNLEVMASCDKSTKTSACPNFKRPKPAIYCPRISEGSTKVPAASTLNCPEVATDCSKISGEEKNWERCASKTCKIPEDSEIFWIQCDHCDDWYHFKCVRISNDFTASDKIWFCKICDKKIFT